MAYKKMQIKNLIEQIQESEKDARRLLSETVEHYDNLPEREDDGRGEERQEILRQAVALLEEAADNLSYIN